MVNHFQRLLHIWIHLDPRFFWAALGPWRAMLLCKTSSWRWICSFYAPSRTWVAWLVRFEHGGYTPKFLPCEWGKRRDIKLGGSSLDKRRVKNPSGRAVAMCWSPPSSFWQTCWFQFEHPKYTNSSLWFPVSATRCSLISSHITALPLQTTVSHFPIILSPNSHHFISKQLPKTHNQLYEMGDDLYEMGDDPPYQPAQFGKILMWVQKSGTPKSSV